MKEFKENGYRGSNEFRYTIGMVVALNDAAIISINKSSAYRGMDIANNPNKDTHYIQRTRTHPMYLSRAVKRDS